MRILLLPLLMCCTVFSFGQGTDCTSATVLTPSATCTPQNYQTNGLESWFSFVATTEFVNIEVITTDAGVDAPHVHGLTLLSGSCGSQSEVDHDELAHKDGTTKLAIDLNSSGLTIGNTYYIKLSRSPFSDVCRMSNCSASCPAPFSLCVQEIDIIIPSDPELGVTSYEFETNKGQLLKTDGTSADDIIYYTHGGEPAIFAAKNGVAFVYYEEDANTGLTEPYRVDMTHVGGTAGAKIFSTEKTQGFTNYFLPQVDGGVRMNRSYERVIYKEVYPNIDLHLYSNRKGIKLYYVLSGDANPADLVMQFAGATSTSTTGTGGLAIQTTMQNLEFERAHVFRINPAGMAVPMPTSGDFVSVGQNQYSINIQGNGGGNMPIVIAIDEGHAAANDPSENPPCWSTYLGGSQNEFMYGVDVDALGRQHIVGETQSNNFPIINGLGTGFTSPQDVIVGRFNTAHARDWIIFVGGSMDEAGYDVKARGDNTYFCGFTQSSNFFIQNQIGAYNDGTSTGVSDGFVAKADDIGFVRWSTYWGGAAQERCVNLAFDDGGGLYMVGTVNNPSTGFPTMALAGAYNQAAALDGDGWIAHFDNADALTWSSFFGGTDNESVRSVIVDAAGNPIISGTTTSTDLPTANPGGGAFFDNTFGGGVRDNFLTKFGSSNQLLWSTYIGGSGDDVTIFEGGAGLHQVDVHPLTGDIYMAGSTNSTDFPLLNSGAFYNGTNGNNNGYLMRFDANTFALKWSTHIGDLGNVQIGSVICAPNSRVILGGSTGDINIPTLSAGGASYFKGQRDGTLSYAADGCMFAFDQNDQQIWGTYFGGEDVGNPGEYVADMVATPSGDLYMVGFTGADGMLTLPFPLFDPGGGAFYEDVFQGGSQDGFITKLCINEILNVETAAMPFDGMSIYPNPTDGILTVQLDVEPNEVVVWEIYDLSGRIVYTETSPSFQSNMTFDLNLLSKGSYIIAGQSTSKRYVATFMKQ